MKLQVAVLGYGLVGREFIAQVLRRDPEKTRLRVVAVSNSRAMKLFGPKDAPESPPAPPAEGQPDAQPASLDALLQHLVACAPVVLVDCTSSDAVAQAYPRILAAGVHIATPNKKAFSGDQQLWTAIEPFTTSWGRPVIVAGSVERPVYLLHEATVGAGLPILSTLRRLLDTGDTVCSIQGLVSGTLSYVFNEFSPATGKADDPPAFSRVIAAAQEKGYTEPDPRSDLDGSDVARKVAILARICGLSLDKDAAQRAESLVPEPICDVGTTAEFLRKLPDFDSHFARLRDGAAEKGCVLRYVGHVNVGEKSVKAGLVLLDRADPLAQLQGADNIVRFETEYFPNGLVIQGAGAGAAVTAFGVFSDVLTIAERVLGHV